MTINFDRDIRLSHRRGRQSREVENLLQIAIINDFLNFSPPSGFRFKKLIFILQIELNMIIVRACVGVRLMG